MPMINDTYFFSLTFSSWLIADFQKCYYFTYINLESSEHAKLMSKLF